MKYVSIDIETTGLNPETCQVLELGAVIENSKLPIDLLPRFHCYILHPHTKGEPYALAMNQKILYRIATREAGYNYLTTAEVGPAFAKWLTDNDVDPQHVLAAGKNFAGFDLQFLKKLNTDFFQTPFSDHVHFKHRVIDPGSMFLIPGDQEPPNTKLCMERAGIGGEVAHTALEDAEVVVELVRYALEQKERFKRLDGDAAMAAYVHNDRPMYRGGE